MELIKWRDSYGIGVAEMDEQHRQLIDMINTIYPTIREGKDLQAIDSVIAEMERYAELHLQDEERMLTEHNYPYLEDHKAEHESYRQRMDDLKKLLEGDRLEASRQVYHFLRKWLIEHIVEEDKRYGVYLREHGLR